MPFHLRLLNDQSLTLSFLIILFVDVLANGIKNRKLINPKVITSLKLYYPHQSQDLQPTIDNQRLHFELTKN